jgi:hypothetical protein
MAPLGMEAMTFIATDNQNMFTPHYNKAFITEIAPHHYSLLFFLPISLGYHISGCYNLDLTHWTMPTISEGDLTLQAATDLPENLEKMPSPLAQDKARHTKCICNLRTTGTAY